MRNNRLTKGDVVLGFLYTMILTFLYVFNLQKEIVGGLSILGAGLLFHRLSQRVSFQYFLLLMLILTLPFSFISIVGESFFSLFIITQIMFSLNMILNNKTFQGVLILKILSLISLVYLFTIYFISQSSVSDYYFENFIKILLFVSLIFVSSSKINISRFEVNQLLKVYVLSAFIGGLAILIQFLFFKYLGVSNLGTQNQMGLTRLGFAGIFFDYSISSIYIASAVVIVLYEYLNKRILFSKFFDILLILLLIVFSVLTSARSGIASFLFVFGLILIYKKRIKLILISLLLAFPVIQIILFIFEQNRGTSLSNDSGRLSNYQESINFFYDNFILGSKFLGYSEISGNMLPHNFIIDFLVQYGFIYSVMLLLMLLIILKIGYKVQPVLFFLLLMMSVGGLFHASFINTHYVIIPVILILGLNNNENLSRNQ